MLSSTVGVRRRWVRLQWYDTGAHALAVGITLSAMWAVAAIASRRLRDVGLEPVHVVPAFFILWLVYVGVLQPFGRAQPDHYGPLTACWAALQGLPMLALIFWPGREAPPPMSAVYEPAEPTQYLNWRGGG